MLLLLLMSYDFPVNKNISLDVITCLSARLSHGCKMTRMKEIMQSYENEIVLYRTVNKYILYLIKMTVGMLSAFDN